MVSSREIPTDLEADMLNKTMRKKASSRGTAAIRAQVVLYMKNNLPYRSYTEGDRCWVKRHSINRIAKEGMNCKCQLAIIDK